MIPCVIVQTHRQGTRYLHTPVHGANEYPAAESDGCRCCLISLATTFRPEKRRPGMIRTALVLAEYSRTGNPTRGIERAVAHAEKVLHCI
jgi:hypothetical protein